MNDISYYLLSAVAILITLSLHEFAHGYAAYRLGDPTAKRMGRLTVNPLKHLDPFGALCMLFFHFGWAKPVPIDPRYFKKPKRDFALTALAGPLTNLLLAFFSAFLYSLFLKLFISVGEFPNEFLLRLANTTLDFFGIFHIVNIGLGLFNLIPVPPLDGSRILGLILPTRAYFAIMRYERIIYYVLIGWLLLGPAVSAFLLSFPIVRAVPVFTVIAKFFSLSDLLSDAIRFLSDKMIEFWQLLPFLNIA